MSLKLIMLINVKTPTIVGILTFIGLTNTSPESLNAKKSLWFTLVPVLGQISCSMEWSMKKVL